jgi:hypothetical protein
MFAHFSKGRVMQLAAFYDEIFPVPFPAECGSPPSAHLFGTGNYAAPDKAEPGYLFPTIFVLPDQGCRPMGMHSNEAR